MTIQKVETVPFLDADDQSQDEEQRVIPRKPTKSLSQWIVVCGFIVTFTATAWSFWKLGMACAVDKSLALYSPVNHLISYKPKSFSGTHDGLRTIYMPPEEGGLPDAAVDVAWINLFKDGIVKIPRSSAAQLTNWSSPIPGDEDHYITMLDVFHQLHCLDIVRKSLYPARYNGTHGEALGFAPITNEHLEHCIDGLRQLIMCTSDVSTHYWRWEPWFGVTRTYNEVTHTCRNFEAIQEWAAERALREFDTSTYVHDPLRDGKELRRDGQKAT